MSNSEYLMKFLAAMKTQRNLSNRTLRAYECDLNLFVRFLREIDICCASKTSVESYVSKLQNDDLSTASIRRKIASIKQFFKFLVREGYINDSPAGEFGIRFRKSVRLPRILSREDIQRLLTVAHRMMELPAAPTSTKVIRALRNALMLEFLFALGLRIDELVSLSSGDVNADNGSIKVKGKGNRERILYLGNQEVLDLLSKYLRACGRTEFDDGPLFLNRSGKRISTSSVSRIFRNLCCAAEVKYHYTPHCLRHTMATMLLENGADVRSVQEILGHSSITTTQIYLHVSSSRKKEVFSRFLERNKMSMQ